MNRIYASLIVGLLFSSLVFAQQRSSNSSSLQLVLTNTATVLPNLSLALNGGTSLLSTRGNLVYGSIALGLGDVAELALVRNDGVINALGATQPDASWALKVKVLSEEENQPGVSFGIQSSLRWTPDDLYPQDLQVHNPWLYRHLLRESRYDYQITSAHVLVSHQILPFVALHASVGIQQIEYRNLWIFAVPVLDFSAPGQQEINAFHAPDVSRRLLPSGSLGLSILVTPKLGLLTEVQSLPTIYPNKSEVKLEANAGYAVSLAARYLFFQQFSLDVGAVLHTNRYTRNEAEMRIGLNTLLDFQ